MGEVLAGISCAALLDLQLGWPYWGTVLQLIGLGFGLGLLYRRSPRR